MPGVESSAEAPDQDDVKLKRLRGSKSIFDGSDDSAEPSAKRAASESQSAGRQQYAAVDSFRSAYARQMELARQMRARIYVGNIAWMVTEQEIMQIFSSFGTVTNVHMPREGLRSQGFCFVEYTEQRAASLAVASMQNFALGGRHLRVSQPTEQRRPPPMAAQSLSNVLAAASCVVSSPAALPAPAALGASIFAAKPVDPELQSITIWGIPSAFDLRDVEAVFQPFGTITKCQSLPPAPAAGSKPGFTGRALVEYTTEKSAHDALHSLQGFVLGGGALQLQPGRYDSAAAGAGTVPEPRMASSTSGTAAARKPEKSFATTSRILCIENLVGPGEADEDLADEVREECGQFGKVEKIEVKEVGTKKIVRVIVTFHEPGECGKAASALNGRLFGGRHIRAVPSTENASS